MITAISTKNLKSINELEDLYDDEQMIRVRLGRLVALGQVVEKGDLYFPKGILFWVTGLVLYGLSVAFGCPWQAIVRFKNEESVRGSNH